MATAPPILIWSPGGGVPVGPVSNPPVYSQADTTVLIEGQAYVDVVFGSVQTSDEWVLVACEVYNTADLTPLNIWPGIITNRTTAGFRLWLNGLPDTGNYYLHWAVSGINIVPTPATSYQFTGPSSGAFSVAATFTVRLPPSTTLSSPVTVTPSDGGMGGTFLPSAVILSSGSASATFEYHPVNYGAITLSVTNSGTLTDPANIAFTCLASFYDLTGPSSGTTGMASTNFTVALPGGGPVIGTVTVTLHDGGSGGTFTPTSVGLTTGAPSATFTYTPAIIGDVTISATNNGGLTDPSNLIYTATSPIFHRTLTIDHTKVPTTQTDFPVLVSITNTTLKTVANGGHVKNANGYDIQFFSDSGYTTKLKWEIEKWVATTGELVAWVKIASISNSSDTVFYMSYGDATVTTDQSDPVNVWTNNFVGVYHFGNGTTLSVADSLNALNGTNVNGVTATTGYIDGGANFNSASTQYVNIGSSSTSPAATFSCWMQGTSFPAAYNCLIARTTFQVFVKSNGKLGTFIATSGGSATIDGGGNYTLTTGAWNWVTVVYSSVVGLIVNLNAATVIDASIAATGTILATASASRIGSDANTGGREWNGQMDEVRVSSVARSTDWLKTEFNNQNAPGTFITVGVET